MHGRSSCKIDLVKHVLVLLVQCCPTLNVVMAWFNAKAAAASASSRVEQPLGSIVRQKA